MNAARLQKEGNTADLIVACVRQDGPAIAAQSLRRTALRLAPLEVPLREPSLLESAGVVAAIANPTDEGVWLHGDPETPDARGAVCVGGLFGPLGVWWRTRSEPPEGTYALARWDRQDVELVSDICASRTLWYVLTEDVFLASTSQRALVTLLRSFQLQRQAVSWLLSSGTLGPDVAWDARIRRLPPDARLTLDRARWRLDLRADPVDFTPTPGDRHAQVARLRGAIDTICAELNVDLDRWILPLSGGRDSRTLLATLVSSGAHPRCLTWTTRSSLRNPLSDVSIARRLARHYRVEHEIRYLDESPLDARSMLDRFAAANEGRNDDIAAYVDGLRVWDALRERGVDGIIRGDEPFGMRTRPATPENARLRLGGGMVTDYPAEHLIRQLHLAGQEWPPHMRVGEGEDRQSYRSRLSQHGYIAIVTAGLTGLKARYVEIVNPLLSRRVVGAMRSLSPELRQFARVFSAIVHEQATGIPYPRFSSTPSMPELLQSPAMVTELVRELTSPEIERVLPADGAVRVLAALAMSNSQPSTLKERTRAATKQAVAALPVEVYYRMKPPWKGPGALRPGLLALRAVLAGKTIRQLELDAGALTDAR